MAGRLQWIRDAAIKDLSNLVFLLLIPALLFRTMSAVRFEELDLKPLLAYFLAAGLLLAVLIGWRGFNRRSVVLALTGVFSNMVMIGITLALALELPEYYLLARLKESGIAEYLPVAFDRVCMHEFVLSGKGGGYFNSLGKVVDCGDRFHNDLYLHMANAFGMKVCSRSGVKARGLFISASNFSCSLGGSSRFQVFISPVM